MALEIGVGWQIAHSRHVLHARQGIGARQLSVCPSLRPYPEAGVFYVTFVPQFVQPGADVAAYSFILAGLHVLLTLGWFAILIAATIPLGRLLRQPGLTRALDRLTADG